MTDNQTKEHKEVHAKLSLLENMLSVQQVVLAFDKKEGYLLHTYKAEIDGLLHQDKDKKYGTGCISCNSEKGTMKFTGDYGKKLVPEFVRSNLLSQPKVNYEIRIN